MAYKIPPSLIASLTLFHRTCPFACLFCHTHLLTVFECTKHMSYLGLLLFRIFLSAGTCFFPHLLQVFVQSPPSQ